MKLIIKEIKTFIDELTWALAFDIFIKGMIFTIAVIAGVLIFIFWP